MRFKHFSLMVLFSLLSFQTLCAEVNGYTYPSPGIRAFKNGRWAGSDHLFNLSPNVDVYVEVVKAEGGTLPIVEGAIKERVNKELEKRGINPYAQLKESFPPLPFFHVLLMISPTEDGYFFYCSGRLFEQVKVDRVVLPDQVVFQAITWEKQSLGFASKTNLKEEIQKCVDEVVVGFAERFQFYEELKQRHKN